MTSAVLVIDVQRGIFDRDPKPFEAEQVIENINTVTARAREAQVPILFLQQELTSGWMAFGSESWQLQAQLEVGEGDIVIRKTRSDGFLHTTLHETLTSRGVSRLIVCGYASEFCIDSTIRRASSLDYAIHIVSDAHTTHDKEHLTAEQIRNHHNVTLSMSPTIEATPAAELTFTD